MKIAYLSHTSLSDVDFSFLQSAQKMMDITYYVEITPKHLKGAAINLNECYPKTGVFSADVYPPFGRFKGIIDLTKVRVINTSGKRWLLKAFISNYKLYKELKKEKYDVIHITWPLNFYELILYFLRKRMVLTVHDPFSHSSNTTFSSELRRFFAFRFLRYFIVLNKNQKNEFIEQYHLHNKTVFESSLSCYSYLPQILIKKEKKNNKSVLFFGRITAYKGLDILFPAFEEVHKKHPDVLLIVAGGGEYYFDISQYQGKPYFRILNRFIPDEELASLIQDAAFTVCPYKDATQSGVAMSAFAFNKPVIATSVGGLPEMLGDGKYGIIVPPSNVDALTSAINQLLEDQALLDELTRNIETDYVYGDCSWGKICEQHEEIYRIISACKDNR